MLVETHTPEAAVALRESAPVREAVADHEATAGHVHVVAARNGRRIGDVDKSRDGVFLFNYFHGPSPEEMVQVWEYTAGWFTHHTRLDNSVLLVPIEGERSPYTVIHHCRWDGLLDIVPHLAFRPSLRRYVGANFDANAIVPMPVLYRLA